MFGCYLSLAQEEKKLRDIHSLVGLLNFACLVVTPGPPFLGRLTLPNIKRPGHL